MTSRSDRVVQVFEAAILLEPAERAAFVREACGDDPDVHQQVEAMLADAERSVMIDRPVGEAVGHLFDVEPMVAAGTRFGPYQVDSLLGAGGMGEVYRATDTVLGREVAIKILPADVSRDPERTARFRREAKILASLNHSNIGAIYGVESAGKSHDAALGLVLELIEGPTLADRLQSGALPLDEVLATARQIAEALDAAHQQGVVHRDLKPGNIKVRDDGVVKVLDFGLARVDQMQAEASSGRLLADSPTITTPAMTAAGVLLGTAAYMSPEQAKGRPADKRSDVWAFGCVLYEMLTGTRAFGGDDVADTLASVLRGEPDYTLLPRDTPDAVRALLRGCLTKDRHRRIGDVSAVRFVLDNIAVLGATGASSASSLPHRSFTWRRGALLTAAGMLIAAAAGAIVWFVNRPSPLPVTAYDISPSGAAAVFIDAVSRDLTVLPDGSIVYKAFGTSGSGELFLRRRDRADPMHVMTGGSPRAPFSSPDGRQIGFVDIGPGLPQVKTMPLAGGPSVLVATLDGPSAGITWGDNDDIIFATSVTATGLQRVRSGAQTLEVLTRPDASRGEGDHLWPHYLPGARGVLFTVTPLLGANERSDIAVLDLEAKTQKRLGLPGASHPHYTSSGHLVYLSGATLFAVPFDLGSFTVQGRPSVLPYQVMTIPSGAAEFDIGRDGTLAYVPAGSVAHAPRTLVWVDRDGRETQVGAPEHEYMQPRLSPDNTKLAVYIGDTDGDVYLWDFALRKLTRLTLEAGSQLGPIWMDDRHIAYASQPPGAPSGTGTLVRRAVDGTGDAEPLVRQNPIPAMLPTSVFNGTLLASTLFTASDVLQVTLPEGHFSTWWQTPFFERNGEISPDGRWVAYEASNPAQTLDYNIYVRPRANPKSAQWQITTGGARQPAWSRDGKELYYVGFDGALYGVQVEAGGATPNPRPPRTIVSRPYYQGILGGAYAARMYDVSKDGQRFLMIKDALPDRSATNASILVRHQWLEEVKRLVPAR